MNRLEAPAFGQVEHIELIKAEPVSFANGLKLFVINGGEQELVRIEFIFKNVNWNVAKPLQAYAVNSMISDGTSQYTASQIAERIDYYGAFIQTEYNYDMASVTIHSLNKHLASILPIVKSLLTDSIFPEEELETFKRNQKQKLSVSLEKNDVVSRRTFNRALFGDTIYGYTVTATDYDQIARADLIKYFREAYQPANCTVILAGRATEEAISLISNHFGEDWTTDQGFTVNTFEFSRTAGLERYVEKPQALQSAIRVGQTCVNRQHPDFPALQVLNTVLGGYFGSRLMANIREDKGYTYGIGSALVSLQNAGYFFIASDVGAEVCSAAVSEIEKEIKLLREQPVPAEELDLVRNYMMGSLLGSLENAFSHADKFKNIYFLGLGYDYYDTYINTVRTITSERLQELANKYLDFDSFEKVIVGKK
ncbi:MAG: insulinase family protein [Sphingobacteriaceae bacterium]|jgi:predicted Zn-dependent peptidase|nr:insulinase family protein [Sphingobacteriaceae bacterium]